jgi:3-oxoadipate CoA-transferase alpha subunit
MIDKIWSTVEEATSCVEDGQTVLVSGFGESGVPNRLLQALVARRLRDLVIVSNNAGSTTEGIGALLAAGCVRRIICSYPRSRGSVVFEELYRSGRIELELVPQGTLVERLRAGGSGIGGFYTPTAADTLLSADKETRVIDGRLHVLEYPINGDVSLIRARRADRWGNLVYYRAMRNFAPIMAAAVKVTIAEVDEVVPLGAIDPDHVHTPGIYVDRVVSYG